MFRGTDSSGKTVGPPPASTVDTYKEQADRFQGSMDVVDKDEVLIPICAKYNHYAVKVGLNFYLLQNSFQSHGCEFIQYFSSKIT